MVDYSRNTRLMSIVVRVGYGPLFIHVSIDSKYMFQQPTLFIVFFALWMILNYIYDYGTLTRVQYPKCAYGPYC